MFVQQACAQSVTAVYLLSLRAATALVSEAVRPAAAHSRGIAAAALSVGIIRQ